MRVDRTKFAGQLSGGATPVPFAFAATNGVSFKGCWKQPKIWSPIAWPRRHYIQRQDEAPTGRASLSADANRWIKAYFCSPPRPKRRLLRFPLGTSPKNDTRALAAKLRLSVRTNRKPGLSALSQMRLRVGDPQAGPEAANSGDIVEPRANDLPGMNGRD